MTRAQVPCDWDVWEPNGWNSHRCGRKSVVDVSHPLSRPASESQVMSVCGTHKNVALRSGWYAVDLSGPSNG